MDLIKNLEKTVPFTVADQVQYENGACETFSVN